MWVAYAFSSAIFAGLVAVLAKLGIRHTPSNLATAVRTSVVLVFAWLMVFVVGSESTLAHISGRALLFLVLSGLATGGSWLCYFRALQIGPINGVVAVDKSSLILTVLLGITLFGETAHLATKLLGVAVLGLGTALMLQRRPVDGSEQSRTAWIAYALASAVFAALTTILAKVGITGVESNLGTAIRTIVVLLVAWAVVFAKGEQCQLRVLSRRELTFLVLSGLATGGSWLCFYKALQTGPVSGVVPIDKLSVLFTALLAWMLLSETVTRRQALGLVLITGGTLVMLL